MFKIPQQIEEGGEKLAEAMYGSKQPFGKHSFLILSALTVVGILTMTKKGRKLMGDFSGKKKKRRRKK